MRGDNSIRPTDAIVTFELNHLVIRPDNETRGNPLRDEVAPLSPVSDLKEQRRLAGTAIPRWRKMGCHLLEPITASPSSGKNSCGRNPHTVRVFSGNF